MTAPLKLALIGAGLIGRRHVTAMRKAEAGAAFTVIVDPAEEVRAFAAEHGAMWRASVEDMLAEDKVDGVVIATPNQLHLSHGLACLSAKLPVLMEKPIAVTTAEARQLVDAAALAQAALLIGHHRRHNPLIKHAKAVIDSGALGQIIAVQAVCWLAKPEPYFAPEWRRRKGAGPVLVNAIHDIDLLRWLCGDIVSVQAMGGHAARGFETEDTAAALLRFKSGAVGTLSVSDAIAAPWSWESTSGENPSHARVAESCYLIGGAKGSLSIPDNRLWRHEGENASSGHWKSPLSALSFPCDSADPLVAQLEHFAAVIRGDTTPLVSGAEGMASLRTVEAILASADQDGAAITLG